MPSYDKTGQARDARDRDSADAARKAAEQMDQARGYTTRSNPWQNSTTVSPDTIDRKNRADSVPSYGSGHALNQKDVDDLAAAAERARARRAAKGQ